MAQSDQSESPQDESMDATVNSSGNGAPTLRSNHDDRKRFRIIREHASGGLGNVSVAIDEQLQREVALKEMQFPYADDMELQNRFVREAEITGTLEHPGIVPVYGLGRYADGRPYYAMRLIDGQSLKQAIQQLHGGHGTAGNLYESGEFRDLLGRMTDVCNALEFAHSRDVIHRDIKPSNIMLGKFGETLVVDWGLAKKTGAPDDQTEAVRTNDGASSSVAEAFPRTEVGSTVGTPAYISPEQAKGDPSAIGKASDVFCLGATLYCVLTGQPPHVGTDRESVLLSVKEGRWKRPSEINHLLPKPLEKICLKAMAVEPADRYESCAALANDIKSWLADLQISAHPDTLSMRTLRWLRRHRGVALAGGAALVALSALSAMWAIASSRQANKIALQKEEISESLYRSLTGEARALIATNEQGFRPKVWQLIEDAAQLKSSNPSELRQIAIDSMNEFSGNSPQSLGAFDDANRPVCLSTSSDGSFAVVGFHHGLCCLYDLDNSKELARLDRKGYVKAAHVVASLPEQEFLLRWVNRDGSVFSGDSRDNWQTELLGKLELGTPAAKIASANFSENGDFFTATIRHADSSRDRTNRVWRTSDWSLIDKRSIGRPLLNSRISNDGKVVAGCFHDENQPDGYVKWRTGDKTELVAEVEIGSGNIYHDSFSMSADGQLLGIGCRRSMVLDELGNRLCDVKRSEVRMSAISKDNRLAAFCYVDGVAEVRDVATTQILATLSQDGERQSRLVRPVVAFSGDGTFLVATNFDSLTVWKLVTERNAFASHAGGVPGLKYSPDGSLLVSAGDDQVARVWDSKTLELLREIPCGASIQSIQFSSDGRWLATGAGLDAPCQIWSTESWRSLLQIGTGLGAIGGVAFSQNGLFFAAAGANGMAVWKVTEIGSDELNAVLHYRDPLQSAAQHLNVGPQNIACWVTDHQKLNFFDIANKKTIETDLDVRRIGWNGVHYFPNGDLAIVNPQGVLERRSQDGRKLLATIGKEQSFVTPLLAILPNGKLIAGVPSPGRIAIWDTTTKTKIFELPCRGAAWSLAWNPRNSDLAIGSSTGQLVLWRTSAIRESLKEANLQWN